jgi:hypothetical protein
MASGGDCCPSAENCRGEDRGRGREKDRERRGRRRDCCKSFATPSSLCGSQSYSLCLLYLLLRYSSPPSPLLLLLLLLLLL